jgi:hypothetical protein
MNMIFNALLIIITAAFLWKFMGLCHEERKAVKGEMYNRENK